MCDHIEGSYFSIFDPYIDRHKIVLQMRKDCSLRTSANNMLHVRKDCILALVNLNNLNLPTYIHKKDFEQIIKIVRPCLFKK